MSLSCSYAALESSSTRAYVTHRMCFIFMFRFRRLSFFFRSPPLVGPGGLELTCVLRCLSKVCACARCDAPASAFLLNDDDDGWSRRVEWKICEIVLRVRDEILEQVIHEIIIKPSERLIMQSAGVRKKIVVKWLTLAAARLCSAHDERWNCEK